MVNDVRFKLWDSYYSFYLLGSIFIGYITKDMIIGVGTDFGVTRYLIQSFDFVRSRFVLII